MGNNKQEPESFSTAEEGKSSIAKSSIAPQNIS